MSTDREDGVPLSVVMTTGGDLTLLGRTVPAVLRSGFEPSRDELIVVLDGPAVQGRQVLDELTALSSSVQVVTPPEHRGAAGARLLGVTRARHDIVVLVDGDVELESFALQEHRRFHQQGGGLPILLVGAMPVVESDRQGINELPTRVFAQHYRDVVRGWETAPHTIAQTLWLGHGSLRRADLLAAETVLPTARLGPYADTDLGLRLSVVGVRMHYSARARARRHHRQDLGEFFVEAGQRGRSAAHLGQRWPTVPVGPTAPSGQSLVRTVTSSLFRRPWVVRAVERWLRRAPGQASERRRAQVLTARDLVEQAWFDHELRQTVSGRGSELAQRAVGREVPLTRRFANTGRSA